MSAWNALVSRITIFPGPPATAFSAIELYQKVWGGSPDNYQKSPNVLLPSIAQGRRSNLTIACAVNPTRIDFTLSPFVSPEDAATSLALIEDTVQLHAELVRLIESIDQGVGADSVSRVGLFLHFIRLASNVLEANKWLTEVMPEQYRVRITEEEDFIFQINRPGMSRGVEEVKMNYVMKWSLDRFSVFNLTMAPMAASGSRSLGSSPKDFISSAVTFDYNNVPVSFSLDAKQQSSLLREGLIMAEKRLREIGLRVEGF